MSSEIFISFRRNGKQCDDSQRRSSFVGASYSYEQITASFSIRILLIVVHHFSKRADCVPVVLQYCKSLFAERYLLPNTTAKSKCLLSCEDFPGQDIFATTKDMAPVKQMEILCKMTQLLHTRCLHSIY